jgi:hypothetical protein
MSEFLDRAKAAQAKVAGDTMVYIKLDLLEGLIADIEHLRREVQRLQPGPGKSSIRAIREGLELKQKEEP